MAAPEDDAELRAGSSSGAGASAGQSVEPDEQRIRSQLREWVRSHSKAAQVSELDDQTPLLESGLLTSLDIVELVLFIEELRGAEIETDDIEPHVFNSVDTLWHAFFGEERRGEQP